MPTTPYGPVGVPEPEPPRRSGRSTAALIVVALVVALGAGGSVYALMSGGDGSDGGGDSKASSAPGAPATTGPTTSEPSASTASPTTQAPPGAGAVPETYLGTWNASIDNDTGHNTRQLVIRQGEVGDTVLALTADGPAGSGSYHCVFEAPLTVAPDTGGPLEIGPSEVTVGEPASSCSPGSASEVTLLPDGTLRRVNTASGESLTYTKSG